MSPKEYLDVCFTTWMARRVIRAGRAHTPRPGDVGTFRPLTRTVAALAGRRGCTVLVTGTAYAGWIEPLCRVVFADGHAALVRSWDVAELCRN